MEVESHKNIPDEVPPYRMITTFNAQLTKWTFLLCGVVIGALAVIALYNAPYQQISYLCADPVHPESHPNLKNKIWNCKNFPEVDTWERWTAINLWEKEDK